MGIVVRLYEDPQLFWAAAEEFLRSRAVLHNLILTIVDNRMSHVEPGRYWLAIRDGQVAGLALQSPLTYPATLVPMATEVADALVDAITDAGVVLPGVNGEVATAASFTGRWTERNKTAAFPAQGLRLYELAKLNQIAFVKGQLRKAEGGDRALALAWLQEFYAETNTPASDLETVVDSALESDRLWLWQNGSAVSMAISSQPIHGVVRISAVYTPKESRAHGYAEACVHGVSTLLSSAGYRCMLYTDLGNPISNSIYRRIGYKAIAEAIHYRFGPL